MKKTFFLYKSGTLKRRDDSLVLIEKNDNVIYIPIEQINQILCFSEIDLNKRVLSLLNNYDITISFFNYYGNYIGRFSPKKYSDGKLLIEQIKAYESEKRLYIAKQIILGELANCVSLLKYYRKKGAELNEQITIIENLKESTDNENKVEQLLLIEATAKKAYYSCFDEIIKDKSFVFDKRMLHPPGNEVNALLSYGYAILYGTVLSDIDQSKLLSQISFIHSLSKQSDSLQFDIADILKPVIVDRLVFRLINKKQIRVDCFEFKGEEHCYLNKKGIKIFVEAYEELITTSVKIGKRYYSYRNLITREVYNLSNYIEGKSDEYTPFEMRW